jgi:hypothetical protein
MDVASLIPRKLIANHAEGPQGFYRADEGRSRTLAMAMTVNQRARYSGEAK